ncbi:MAG: ABC transporter ATP-binding protein [Streptococcaceae bacterium]|jgi:ABC-2 type transport system ATP-binding protein|nr:ABC transporter ATP-binding protein [Streptococcaceae bacterium]
MNETVLKLTNVSKEYKKVKAVDNVNMTIQKGDIYGLIGKNGAGKTTLIRMITSLCHQTQGEIEIFGQTSVRGVGQARARIGCVIEMPAFYPNLTATANLEYYQRVKGIPNKKRVSEVLELVDLANTGKKRYKNFSLGMKQRLGIALAILNNPDFIILDEPINGLDPQGIVEIRELILKLNKEHNMTVMISSHLLAELSLIATRYGIIHEGKLVKEITHEQLEKECKNSLSIQVDDVSYAATIIETHLHTNQYKIINENEIRMYDYIDQAAKVNMQLVKNDVHVFNISKIGESLEDYFISLISGGSVHV